MEQKEILITLKAIEFMSYGIDISKFTTVDEFKGYVNSNTKQYISRLSPTVTDFIWELDSQVKNFLGLYATFVVRHEKSFSNLERDDDEDGLLTDKPTNIIVTYDMIVKTMQQLYKQGICRYSDVDEDVLDPTIQERLDKIDAEFDRLTPPDNEMTKALSKDAIKKNFEILTAVAYQNHPEVKKIMLDAFNIKRTHFDIKSLAEFPVVDERIYIPLSEADRYRIKKYLRAEGCTSFTVLDDLKYIVISKNLYDYYFCSYGSEFQSCYSLTSTHLGWYGMLPLGTIEGHYIIYGTKDKPNKTAILGDNHKWSTPYMFFRCWGWTSNSGELLVDKAYTNQNILYRAVKENILSKYMLTDVDKANVTLKDSQQFREFINKHDLRFYPDSVKVSTFKFRLCSGDRDFMGRGMPRYDGDSDKPVSKVLTSITSVKDSFNPYKDIAITNGVLINPKVCPITKLLIDDSETQSKYAKYLNNPVEGNFMVVTYCDGSYKMDAINSKNNINNGAIVTVNGRGELSPSIISIGRQFQDTTFNTISLKSFKERLKGSINKSKFDLILLRVIEDDKVNYIKYKRQGVKA